MIFIPSYAYYFLILTHINYYCFVLMSASEDRYFVLKSVGPKMFDFEFACSFFVKKDRPDIGKHVAHLGLKTGGERYVACLRQTAAHFRYTSACFMT